MRNKKIALNYVFILTIILGLSLAMPLYAQPPAWYHAVEPAASAFLKASGTGASEEEAIADALKKIAEQILVDIRAETSLQTQVNNDKASFSGTRKIETRISDFRISDYQKEKSMQADGAFWVRLAVRKQDLRDVNLREATDIMNELAVWTEQGSTKGNIDFLRRRDSLYEKLALARQKYQMIAVLDKAFSYQTHSEKILAYEQAIDKALKQSVIYVVSDADMRFLGEKIARKLNEEGFAAVMGEKAGYITLKISGSFTEHDHITSYKFVTADILFTLSDETGTVRLTKSYPVNARGMTSFAATKKTALNKFMRTLLKDDKTIAQMLTLD